MALKNRFPRLWKGGVLAVFLAIVLVTQGWDWIGLRIPVSKNETSVTQPACALAVIRHQGDDALDRRIVKIQEQMKSAGFKPFFLENLGWAYIEKARTAFDPGYYSLAEASAQCIEVLSPNSPSALLLQAHADQNLHRFKQAEIKARALIAKRGAWFDYAVLGDALMEQGKIDQAARSYQMMMNIRPGPQAFVRAAHLRWLTGDLDGAIDLLDRTIPALSTSKSESSAWIHVRFADYLSRAGGIEESQALLKKALLLFPDYPPALLALGRLHLAQSRVEEALPLVRRATEINPLPEYQWTLIEALQQNGDETEMLRRKQIMETRGPIEDRRTYVLYRAGTGHADSGLLELITQELRVRNDIFTLDAMAWALYALGDYQKALEYIEKAMRPGTRDARLYLHRGLIALANRNFDQARSWLEQTDNLRHTLLPSERKRLSDALERLRRKTSVVSSENQTEIDPQGET